mmetsp:Transcript_13505/g.23025  ORF Transcript_13505/g.23025 Transcript_13505/m.23025 type:complete len:361 (-) Transcript_13505:72-1154(-)
MQSELRLSLLQRRQNKVQAAATTGNNSNSSSSSALEVPPVTWLPDGGNGNPTAPQQSNFFGHTSGMGAKAQPQNQTQNQNQNQTLTPSQQKDKRVDFLKLPQEIQLPFNIGRNANVNTSTTNHAMGNQEAAAASASAAAYNQDQYNYNHLQNLPKKSPRNLTYQEEENESRRKLFALVSPKGRGVGTNGLVMESPRRAEGGAFTPRGNNVVNVQEIPSFVTPQQRQNAAAQRQAAQQGQYQAHPAQVQQGAAGSGGHDHHSGGSTSGTGTTNLTSVDSKEIRREKNKESARKYRQRKREVDDEKANRLRNLEQENRLLVIELRATYDHAVSLMNAAKAARVIPEDEVVPYNAYVMNPNPS